ncbi:bifunctional riboflavin kinase/FMN adenylyltransferase [Bifidobacterium catulorum]|uniref:Bifunctional riboflavin kinase/FMN adenylyltransferase n=1 Tax=Bifidobacterium catulorum TaxID=1630173 RepID=A0A2U2MQU9_9BIFI|nr:riboflavin kinase [Bifidobacterium catulorum]PWG59245.1 bifunctional riboflavin kinase/FMN adenylyltransferase [Bifidobacterium catulorum]
MRINTLVPDTEGDLAWPPFGQDKRSVVAVGNFDGVHRGHQAVLKRTVDLAKSYGCESVAVVFDPRPTVVRKYAQEHDGAELPLGEFYPDPYALTDIGTRLDLIEKLGLDRALVIRYSMAFGAKSYQYFLGQLVGKIGMRNIVLGRDSRMGAGRAGDPKSIDSIAQATRMFEVDVVDDRGPGEVRVPLVNTPEAAEIMDKVNDPDNGLTKAERRALSKSVPNHLARVWSSTYVRYLLSHGHVEQAADILGRPHEVNGRVVGGKQRGRTLGFPTANVAKDVAGFMPADGVYAGWLTDVDPETGEERRYPSAISIGTKITFGEPEARVLEAYAVPPLDADGNPEWLDLYDHHVRVEFVRFLRPQVQFDGADELVAELKRNVEQTKEICK